MLLQATIFAKTCYFLRFLAKRTCLLFIQKARKLSKQAQYGTRKLKTDENFKTSFLGHAFEKSERDFSGFDQK